METYAEYEEFSTSPVSRREIPGPASVLVIELGDPILAAGAAEDGNMRSTTAFLGSPGRGPAVTWHGGFQHCIEIRLTLHGTYQLFGSMRDLAGCIVPLDALWGCRARQLTARLASAGAWHWRFDLLDRVLGTTLMTGTEPDPEVVYAWTRLHDTAGNLTVGTLVSETGWNRGRLAERFRAQTGLAPKVVATLLRFHRAIDLIDQGVLSLTSIAASCGYYDQAHFNRDFRTFAGCSPTEWTNSRFTGLVGAGTHS